MPKSLYPIPKKAPRTFKEAKALRKRYSQAVSARRNIRVYQNTTACVMRKAEYIRFLKHLLHQVLRRSDMRISKEFANAFQLINEAHAIFHMEGIVQGAIHASRKTLMEKDHKLTDTMRGGNNGKDSSYNLTHIA